MKLLDRIAGKIHYKLFGMRCDINPGIKYFDESHFDGLKKDDFEFKNANGFTLRGGFYHYDDFKKDTLVIFCHGVGGGHQAYMKEIEYIARNGYKVLGVDYQGTILSDGNEVGGLTGALVDMTRCVEIVKKDYKNIYVVGHSWGGWVASGLTHTHREIKKCVLLAGLNSLESLTDQYFKGPLKIFRKSLYKIEREKYGDLSELKIEENLNREDLKALVLQADNDQVLQFKYNFQRMRERVTNKNVEFVELKDKNHSPTYSLKAVNLLGEYLEKLNKIKDKQERIRLSDTVDFDELCELDEEIMKKIVSFLNN